MVCQGQLAALNDDVLKEARHTFTTPVPGSKTKLLIEVMSQTYYT